MNRGAWWVLLCLVWSTSSHAGLFGWLRRKPTPPLASSARELCARHLRVLTRIARNDEMHVTIDWMDAHNLLLAYQAKFDESKQAQTAADDLVPVTNRPSAPGSRMPDGLRWVVTDAVGEPPHGPNSQAAIAKRLKRMEEIFAKGKPGPDISIVYSDDPRRILEMLRGDHKQPDSMTLSRRQFAAATALGVLGFTVPLTDGAIGSERAAAEKNRIFKAIIANALATTVTTRAKHLELLRTALENRENPPGKEAIDAALADHARWLDRQEKLGKPIKYGRRFADYDRIRRRWGPSIRLSDLEELTTGWPELLTEKRLQDILNDKSSEDPKGAFTADDIKEAERGARINSEGIPKPGQLISMFVGAVAGATIGYYLPSDFLRKRVRLATSRGYQEVELKDLEKLVESVVKGTGGPEAPQTEWYWIGSSVKDGAGDNTDFMLHIDRRGQPPVVQLMAMRYPPKTRTKLVQGEDGTMKKVVEQAPAGPPPPPLPLDQLYAHLELKKFPTLFGDDIKPLQKVFADARALGLREGEARRFQQAALAMNAIADVAQLERQLALFRAERTQRSQPGAPK